MSLSRTLTTFVVDISSSMGEKRIVHDEVYSETGEIVEQERTTTNLEWCLDFVSRKTQEIIFAGLKTATMSIITFGSPRTKNAVIDADPDNEGYRGVDEIAPMGQPTVATLELLRTLRAVRPDEGGEPPDALDAIICALTAMSDPERGGIASTSKSYRRTIYLITDAKHSMNKDSTDAIADRIKEDNVSLRVIGVDFDDRDDPHGFQERGKPAIKAQNEEWWHNWLQQLPNSRIATAALALEQAALPIVSLQSSAAYATSLTFGDPDAKYTTADAMSIPVKMLKLTTRVLPMSRKTMSKLSEQTQGAKREKQATQQAMSQYLSQDGLPMATPTPVLPVIDSAEKLKQTLQIDQRRVFFLSDEVKEVGTDNAKPLPEGAENDFRSAYKLGASIIPITPDMEFVWASKQGLEIINWVKQSTFKRHFLLGEIWNIFADSNNLEAQLQMSSLAKAMRAQDKLALVRFVRKDDGEPKLGVLYPVTRLAEQSEADYFHFSEVPFSEDLKRYTFPSLDRVITVDGKELKEHRSLPSAQMVDAMESLVDSLDLTKAYRDEEGNELPWFSTEDSFNPAIHRMKEAVAWRVIHPDSKELPRPHWEVDKFLDRPRERHEASQEHVERCKSLFNIRYYPEKGIIKAREKREREDKEKARADRSRYELNLADANDNDGGKGDADTNGHRNVNSAVEATDDATSNVIDLSQSQKKIKVSSTQQSQSVQGKLIEADSDTEDEEEENMLAPIRPPAAVKEEPRSQQPAAPKPVEAEEAEDSPPPPPPVNLLASDPAGSFEMCIESGKVDEGEVFRALQRLIVRLVSAGEDESSRLARDALVAGKDAAAKYDEAREWNAFVMAFKRRLNGGVDEQDQGQDQSRTIAVIEEVNRHLGTQQRPFWNTYCKGNRRIGLVTSEEDEGARSKVSPAEADEFVNN